MKKEKCYALYKGDEYLMMGTIDEIAKFLNVKHRTIINYATPFRRKQIKENSYVVIRIED